MLKKIFISAGIVIVIMGITVGAIYVIQQRPFGSNQGNTDGELVLDLSKDYGACDMLDTSSIQSALGQPADTIQPAKNTGITPLEPTGEDTGDVVADLQTCVYAFEAGGDVDNGFNANNGLTVEKTLYTNKAGADAIIAQIQLDPGAVEVETLSDAAFFLSSTDVNGPDAVYSFDLHVFSNTEHTTYSIRQPADNATFTAETARTALVSLSEQ
jgi:hypothetical protein